MRTDRTGTSSTTSRFLIGYLAFIGIGASWFAGIAAEGALEIMPSWYQAWGSGLQWRLVIVGMGLSAIGSSMQERPMQIVRPVMMGLASTGVLNSLSFYRLSDPDDNIPAMFTSIAAILVLLIATGVFLEGGRAIVTALGFDWSLPLRRR